MTVSVGTTGTAFNLDPLDGARDPRQLDRPLYKASFGQGFKRFFQKYADFTGRASPREFWWGFLSSVFVRVTPVLLMFAIALASESLDPYSPNADSVNNILGIAGLFTLLLIFLGEFGVILPFLALTWRRLHDANMPGPLALLSFIPFFGVIVLLVMVLMPSTPAGRRYDRQAWAPIPGIPPQGYPTQAFLQPPQ